MKLYVGKQNIMSAVGEKNSFHYLLPADANVDDAITAAQLFADHLIDVKNKYAEAEIKEQEKEQEKKQE